MKRFLNALLPRAARRLSLVGALLLLEGCERQTRPKESSDSGSPNQASRKSNAPLKLAELPTVQSVKSAQSAPSEAPPEEGIRLASSRFRLGPLTDIGPAAPARAAPEGVYLATKGDALLLARRNGKEFETVEAPPEAFSRYGRAPSLSSSRAYWVSPRGALLAASRSNLEPELLVDGARSGTRTAVTTLEGTDLVAFIRDDPSPDFPRAFLYAGPGQIFRLSEDLSTATSVALFSVGKEAHLFALEGRIGLSSLHHRTVRLEKGKAVVSGDEVTSVLPGSHALTEVGALAPRAKPSFAFLAMSEDTTHFGLAELNIDRTGNVAGGARWLHYPNGIDPAPVAADEICGEPHIAYARPSTEKPRAPQELRLKVHSELSAGDGELIATSRAFNDISLSARPGGAVLVWTADRRTWAVTLDCGSR